MFFDEDPVLARKRPSISQAKAVIAKKIMVALTMK
jgi:hypothetical protein